MMEGFEMKCSWLNRDTSQKLAGRTEEIQELVTKYNGRYSGQTCLGNLSTALPLQTPTRYTKIDKDYCDNDGDDGYNDCGGNDDDDDSLQLKDEKLSA
jgi:hypothetical protein